MTLKNKTPKYSLPTIQACDIDKAIKRSDALRSSLLSNPTAYSRYQGSRYCAMQQTLGEFLNDNNSIFSLSEKKKEYLISVLSKQFGKDFNINDFVKRALEEQKTNIDLAFTIAMFEVTNKCKLQDLIL